MVAVGDSAEVELIYHTSSRKRARVSKRATVNTNDKTRGNFQLAFKGSIYENADSIFPLTLSESSLIYTEETSDKELKIKIKNVSDEKVKIRLVSYPYDILKIKYHKKDIKPGKTKDIKVKIDDVFEGETFKKSFTFEVNDSAHTRYTIPVIFKKVQPQPRPAKKDTVHAAPIQKGTKSK